MANEKNNSSTVGSQGKIGKSMPGENWTTEEKAQYEVYRNGSLSRETIGKWIRNDLGAISSFVHGMLTDEGIFGALCDAYYERYKSLHDNTVDEMHKPIAHDKS